MSDNFYKWMMGQSVAAAMDERRIVYRRHHDGSPCYAKDPKDCPLTQHHVAAEEADDLGKPKKVESRNSFGKRMRGLVDRLDREGWTPELSKDVESAVNDVLDGRSEPVRMPKDSMRRDRMNETPKWFLAAYHMASSLADVGPSSNDNVAANRVVEKVLKGIGAWTNNVYGKCQRNLGKPFGSGSESYVFKSGKDKVVKASTLGHTNNVVHAMERLMLSNQVFPGTAHRILGMGSFLGDTKNRPNDHVSFMLEQPKFKFGYFKGEAEGRRALRKLGFRESYGYDYTDAANEITLLDCKTINIPKDRDGRVLFIDPCVVMNHGSIGRLDTLKAFGKKRK